MISRSWSAQWCFAGAFSRPKQSPGEGLSAAAAVQDKRPECIFAGALFFLSTHIYFSISGLLVYHAAAAALIRLRRGSSSSAPRCQVKLNRYFFGRGNKKREDTYFSLLREIHHI